MKKISIVKLIIAFLLLMPFLNPQPAQALCEDGDLTGPKIGNRIDWLTNTEAFGENYIRTKYDEKHQPDSGNPIHPEGCPGDPISVTLLLPYSMIAGNDPQVGVILSKMASSGMTPIIRLFSSYLGGTAFAPIKADDPDLLNAAKNLNTFIDQAGLGGRVIVYIGNEINHPEEWSGYSSAQERLTAYGAVFKIFKNNARSYQMYLPPLDIYFRECNKDSDLASCVSTLVSNAGGASGAALTIYNATPAAMKIDYDTVANLFRANGVNNFIITELGPRVNGKLLDGTNQGNDADIAEWIRIMTDTYKTIHQTLDAGGEYFAGAKHINSSFFLNCNGELSSYLVVIGKDGVVGVETEGGLKCDANKGGGVGAECSGKSSAATGISASGTGLFGFLGGLMSLFRSVAFPVLELDAARGSAFDVFMHTDLKNMSNNSRPLDMTSNTTQDEVAGYVTIEQRGHTSTSVLKSIFGIIAADDNPLSRRNHISYGWLPGVGVDATTKTAVGEFISSTNSIFGYLNGNVDGDWKQSLYNLANAPIDQKDYTNVIEYAGVLNKLWPKEWRDPETSDWGDYRTIEVNRKMRCVMRDYACSLPDNTADCTDLQPCSDESAACVVPAGGGNTWIQFTDGMCEYRPLLVSEFCCTNANCSIPGVSKIDITRVCETLGFNLDGTIDPNGLVYQKFGQAGALKSPAEDAKYAANGPFGQLDGAPRQLLATSENVSDEITPTEKDGTQQNTPVMATVPVLYSWIYSNEYPGRRVARAMSSDKDYNKRNDTSDMPDFSCSSALELNDDLVVSALAGAHQEQDGYVPAKELPRPVVAGATTSQGEVLQAATPPTTGEGGSEESEGKKKVDFSRSGPISIPIPKTLYKFAKDMQLIAFSMLPLEIVEKLNLKIEGIQVKDMASSAVNYFKGDMDGDNSRVPYVGGINLLMNPRKGLIPTEVVMPYDPNRATSVSLWLNDLAMGKVNLQPFAKKTPENPWLDLQSLNAQTKELSLKK